MRRLLTLFMVLVFIEGNLRGQENAPTEDGKKVVFSLFPGNDMFILKGTRAIQKLVGTHSSGYSLGVDHGNNKEKTFKRRNIKAKRLMTIFGFAALLMVVGCNLKDPIFNTSHPGHAMITLTTDWTAIGQGLTIPESYTITVGDHTATLTGATNKLDHLFTPGNYRICIYNQPENITVNGTTLQRRSGRLRLPCRPLYTDFASRH